MSDKSTTASDQERAASEAAIRRDSASNTPRPQSQSNTPQSTTAPSIKASSAPQADAQPLSNRPKINDGKSLREIWRPTDGNGDPDIGVYETTRYLGTGHPTWKIYCGEAPASINGVFMEPPRNVYLDDRACYKILHFAGYTGAERGRQWRHDFDNRGGVKPWRKNRGRPALDEDGVVLELKTGPSKVVRFSGAQDSRDIKLIAEETAAQDRGEVLAMPTPPTGRKNGTKRRKHAEQLLEGLDTPRTRSDAIIDDSDLIIQPNKKQRLSDQTFAAISTNSVSELRATIVSLQDRARITSDAVLDLQRKNQLLEESLKSQGILFNRATSELSAFHSQNATLQAALETKAPTLTSSHAKDLEIVALRNTANIYRTIAIQLWSRQKSTAVVLEKSADAATAIEKLTNVLVGMREELVPLGEKVGTAREGYEEFGGAMRMMLGDNWEEFESAAENCGP